MFSLFSSLEYRRQTAHILFGCLLIGIFAVQWGYTEDLLVGLTLITGGAVLVMKSEQKIPFFHRILLFFERPDHLERFPARGLFFYLLGALIAYHYLALPAAQATVAILAFGDSVTNLVGRRYGRFSTFLNREKMIEGSIAGWVAAGAVASIFVAPLPAFAASALAMIAEIPKLRIGAFPLDDNLVIPVVCVIYFLVF